MRTITILPSCLNINWLRKETNDMLEIDSNL